MEAQENIAYIKSTLAAAGLTPNKALGQNFLIDPAAIRRILDAVAPEGKAVLEIGPGLGALTDGLVQRAERAVAVELDAAMARILSDRFGAALALFRADFLKVDLEEVHAALGGGPFCVAGNLPYYVTTPISLRLLQSALPITGMTLTLQKEGAERFTAAPGARNYGPLSVLAQAYYDVRAVCALPPDCFYPQPQVDSCVISLTRNETGREAALPALLRAAFSMRRKTLVNNLKSDYAPDALRASLQACALSADVRAEALCPADFLRLARSL